MKKLHKNLSIYRSIVEFFPFLSSVSIFPIAWIFTEILEEISTSILLTDKVNNTGRASTYIVILGNKEVNV
jgi:hypothetical protein